LRWPPGIKTSGSEKGNPYVFTTEECTDGHCGEFGYRLLGKTTSGLFVLLTEESGGGSGQFRNLMLVSIEHDHGLAYDERKSVLRPEQERWLIKKWGELPLGDRYAGSITLKGNTIHIGKDNGPTGVVDKDKTIRIEFTR
jgi:hypothetical protein